VLGVHKRTVLVEFTVHSGDEILRDGEWAGDWTAAEATAGRPKGASSRDGSAYIDSATGSARED